MILSVPKISYSLLSSRGKFVGFGDAVAAASKMGVDMIHYDVSPRGPLSVARMAQLRSRTRLPFDVHFCSKINLKTVEGLAVRKNDFLSVHVENGYDVAFLKKIKRTLKCHLGLALNVETPIERLDYAAQHIDYVLFMAAQPGVSGGVFNESVVDKIVEFKRKHPGIQLHADGGVNNYSAAILRDAGVRVLISGSYILKNDDFSNQVVKLVGQNLNLPVSELMRCGVDLPLVCESVSVRSVAAEIDTKTIGCTCVKSRGGQFVGLITDTDIRKRLIKDDNFKACTARDIMNVSPYTVTPEKSLMDLLRELEMKGLFFTVVPVVRKNKECVGVLRLQDILFRNGMGLRIRHL